MKTKQATNLWKRWQDRFGERRVWFVSILLLIGITSLAIHLLFIGGLGHTALLYMLVPYCLSLLIAAVRPYKEKASGIMKFLGHMTTAIVVFLATSIILREGFVCVIFFLPIYIAIVGLAYLIRAAFHHRSNRYRKIHSVAAPLIIVLMSLEGTSGALSLPRSTQVEITRVTPLSVNAIKQNLTKPLSLATDRHWLLSLFPMPYEIEAGSLSPGDVHTIKTRYNRWFITNTHEGEAKLLIRSVGANRIETQIISDTTYFSTYLKANGTQISFSPTPSGETKITLRIDYERRLDPAWYFHPLQQYGVSKMAEFLIDEVLIRG